MKKTKTRTMTIDFHQIKVEGEAWSTELPRLVIEEYDEGDPIKRVVIPMRVVDIEEFAFRLWELHAKFQKAADDAKRALMAPN